MAPVKPCSQLSRRVRIFLRVLVFWSFLLFVTTVVMWVRGFWIVDEWSKTRVFDQGEMHAIKEFNLASNDRALAFQIIDYRFLTEGLSRSLSGNYYPKHPGEENMRQDFPNGESFSHNTYDRNSGTPRFFHEIRLFGFYWKRELNDHEKMPKGPIVDGQKTTQYLTLFSVGTHFYVCEMDTTIIAIPWWFLALLFGIAPARSIFRHYRTRGIRPPGICAKCGYDLRASPERCPECGNAVGTTA